MALPPALTSMRCEANFRNAKNPATESLFIKLASLLFSDTEDLNDARVAGKSVWIGSGEGVPTGSLGADVRGLYLREDAPTIDAMVYVCVNAAWTALKPGGSAWYSGSVATPATDSVAGVHANQTSDVVAWVAPFTSPVVPRNVTATFSATWDGGDITITGTDQFDAALTETIADVAGTTVAGIKIFKTVTAIVHQVAGTGGAKVASVGWGHKLGVTKAITAIGGIMTCDDIDEEAVWDRTYSGFQPTTLPNGAHTYRWAVIG